MNSDTARTVVIAGVGGAVILTVIQELTTKEQKRAPAIYVPIGGVLVMIPLLILADIEPSLAAMIGALIGVGALLLNSKVITTITGTLNTQNLPPNNPGPPSPPQR